MTALASEFAKWRDQLQRFPEELAMELVPILRQLWAALGGLLSPASGGLEPDGISGVSNRERFERLIVSQWLLASEIPEEFLRRAAMHELMFLKSATREPRGSRRLLLAVDSGPSQLGSPRLVHIALLLVLERRARMARAELCWGIAQQPGIVRSSCEQADIEALLESRSCRNPSRAEHTTLLETLKYSTSGDCLIWIGGPTHCELSQGIGDHRICVTDPLREQNDRLTVRLHSRGQARELSLELPRPEMRTHLIRQPFESPSSTTLSQLPGEGDFRFSADGRRILLSQAGKIEAYLPTRSTNYRGSTVHIPANSTLVAYGWRGRSILALTHEAGKYTLKSGEASYAVRFRQRSFSHVGVGTIVSQGKRTLSRILVCDSEGTVFVCSCSTSELELMPILDQVLSLRWRRGHLSFIREHSPGQLEMGVIGPDFCIGQSVKVACAMPASVVTGFDSVHQRGCYAIRTTTVETSGSSAKPETGGCWAISHSYGGQREFEIKYYEQVLGCVPEARSANAPAAGPGRNDRWALLVYNVPEQRLYVVTSEARRPLVRVPAPSTVPQWDELNCRLLYRDVAGKLQLVDVLAPRASFSLASAPEDRS